MKMKLANDLKLLLNQVSGLVDKYESKDTAFVESLKQWLIEGEELLSSNQIHQVSELAGLRGIIIAAERGVYDNSFGIDPNMQKRKAVTAIAILSLNKTQEILQLILKPILDNIEEARTILKQIIVLGNQRGIIAQYWKIENNDPNHLQTLWKNLASTEDICIGLTRIITLVPYTDAIHLMQELLNNWPMFLLNKKLNHSIENERAEDPPNR